MAKLQLFLRSSICFVHRSKRLLSSAIASNILSADNVSHQSLEKPLQGSSQWNRRLSPIQLMAQNESLLINKKFLNDERINDKMWSSIREELQQTFPNFKDKIDGQIHQLCFYYKRYEDAMNYYKFLKANKYNIGLNTVGNYLQSFHMLQRKITKEEEKEILKVYDELRIEYPLLGSKTCSDCLVALCLTSRWKESFELLKMIKEVDQPNGQTMGALICAAFRNNAHETAWGLMKESLQKKVPIHPQVFIEYLEFCKQKFQGAQLEERVANMFNFWRLKNLTVNYSVIKKYAEFYKSIGHKTAETSVSKRGECMSCKEQLNQTTLSEDDFRQLSTSVLRKLIVGKNVYCVTSPQELKRYMLFLKTMKPYDVVIDGLNVAYTGRNAGKGGSFEYIFQALDYFRKYSKKKILVIGRAHMNWWSKDGMTKLQQMADVFLTKNISEDDPFLLHVTLSSGPQTYFVSRDLMRQHKSSLVDSSVQTLFKRWQLSRQYLFKSNKAQGRIVLIPPSPFETNTQYNNNAWHIPFSREEKLLLPSSYDVPEDWLCLRKK